QDVGHRLALLARSQVYKEKSVVYAGPMFQSMQVEGNQVKVAFDHAHGGLKTKDGAAVKGFAVAGADQKFYWASAQIAGDKIFLSSPAVPHPVAVRYGWADNPEANLYNGAGLPAAPF